MTYVRAYADWKDYPDTSTPITEAKLDIMDQGIYNAHYNAIVQSDAVGQIPLTAQGIAGQTADLMRVRSNTSTLVSVDASGSLFLQDVKLTRFAADTLGIEDEVRIIRASDTAVALTLKGISGDPLAQILANGQIQWGNGGGTYDTILSRTGANELSMATGDTFKVAAVGLKFNDNSVQTTAATTPGPGSITNTELANNAVTGTKIAAGHGGADDYGAFLPTTGLFNGYRFTVFLGPDANEAFEMMYRADLDAIHPWHRVSGGPMRITLGTSQAAGASGIWVDIGDVFSFPYTGIYQVGLGGDAAGSGSATGSSTAVGVNAQSIIASWGNADSQDSFKLARISVSAFDMLDWYHMDTDSTRRLTMGETYITVEPIRLTTA